MVRADFVDWLDDHGEHDRAEFIRAQGELEPVRGPYEIPRAAELHRREDQLHQGLGGWADKTKGSFDVRR